MSYKKIHPRAVVMKGEISWRDQNHVLFQPVNIFISGLFNMRLCEDSLTFGASLSGC